MKSFDKFLSIAAWACLGSAIMALALVHLAGDRWWPGTLLLFGPRWALALPLAALLPAAVRRPTLAIPLACAGAVIAAPLMGLRFHAHPPDVPARSLRVMTLNAGGKGFDAGKLSALVRDLGVDIVTLQECKRELRLDLPPGWHQIHPGGVSIFSRHPLKPLRVVAGMHLPDTWPVHCLFPALVSTPLGDLIFSAVHLPTARYGLENILDRRVGLNLEKRGYLLEETANRQRVSRDARSAVDTWSLPRIVAGDFNMPVESAIYRQSWGDLDNAFSETGRGYGWTTRNRVAGLPIPLRIDHILTGNGAKAVRCEVGPDVGSDHLPLVADIAITPD